MVRKTREAALATRQALLAAALEVFRERGVTHTRLVDVAARAGVTRGAIYWHFKDKAELFEAVCERGTLPVEALLAEASRNVQPDPLAKLEAICDGFFKRVDFDRKAINFLGGDASQIRPGRQPEDPDGWMRQARFFCFGRQSKIHLAGNLGGQPVIMQGRHQANHRLGDP